MGAVSTGLLYEIFERMFGGNKKCSRTGCSSIVTRRRAARRQQSEYAVVLTADSILARSTRRRQTSTGWNTAYIGANRYTLPPDEKPPDEKPPDDDALHPMAFLVEKGPGAVTRPHCHQADQFQVVVAGRGMFGDHEFSDGAVHYTDAYSAYGPIITVPSGSSATGSGMAWTPLRPRRPVYAGRAGGA